MEKIWVPQEDVNSQGVEIVEWKKESDTFVNKDEIICEVETTKVIFEIASPNDGYLIHLFSVGDFVEYNQPMAFLASDRKELNDYRVRKDTISREIRMKAKLTKKALQLAQQHGIDITKIVSEGIVTKKDILAMLPEEPETEKQEIIMKPGVSPRGVKRILVLGGGYGAMQVIDILLYDHHLKVVGILDDDKSLENTEIFGVKVLGQTNKLENLCKEGFFDKAIVSISANIDVRKNFYEKCKTLDIQMANAICPTVRINRDVFIGEGNVICSLVHIGICTSIGNNNFISSNNSIEHHNVWGSHNTTGPSCVTSSRVLVGNCVKFGTGIFIQPGIRIGDNCLISSGSIITRTIPDNHALKTKVEHEIKPINE